MIMLPKSRLSEAHLGALALSDNLQVVENIDLGLEAKLY